MLKVEYEGLDKTDVHSYKIKHSPQLNIIVNTTHAIFTITNTDFATCHDIKYEVQLLAPGQDTYISVKNLTDTVMEIQEYKGQELRVR